MDIASTLNHVMTIIWGDEIEDCPIVVKALVSYVKTHGRRNHENVFDVIDILFHDNVRAIAQRPDAQDGPREYLIEVQFDDDSQCLVVCAFGIGKGIEQEDGDEE